MKKKKKSFLRPRCKIAVKNLVAFRYKDEIKDYDVVMANHVYAQHTLGDTFLCHQRFGIGRGAKTGKVIICKSRVEP